MAGCFLVKYALFKLFTILVLRHFKDYNANLSLQYTQYAVIHLRAYIL